MPTKKQLLMLEEERQKQEASVPFITDTLPPLPADKAAEQAGISNEMRVQKEFENQPTWKKPFIAGGDLLTRFANGITAGGLRYMQDPATQKAMDAASIRAGGAGNVAELGGALGGGELVNAAKYAATVPGIMGTAVRTALTGAEGAGWGGMSAFFNEQNPGEGAGLGAGLAVGGKGILSMFDKLIGGGARAVDSASRTPKERADMRIATEAAKDPSVAAKVQALGPEGMVADTGLSFQNLLRSAMNLSPEATTVANTRLAARESIQNETVSNKLLKEAGLKPTNTLTPEQASDLIHKNARDRTHLLYEDAFVAGHDLPLTKPTRGSGQMVHPEGMEDIFKSDTVQGAWLNAYPVLRDRVASGDTASADSVLAHIEETSQILKSKARLAKDPREQGRIGNLAKALDSRTDALMADKPELARARAAKAEEMARRDAVDLGASLAKPKPSVGDLDKVKQVKPENKGLVQKGYALESNNRLSNSKNTAAALSHMNTRTGKAAIETIYEGKAPSVFKTLDDVATMATTKKKAGGGSMGLRDFLEQNASALYSGGGAGLITMLATANPTLSGAVGGSLALGIPAARKAINIARDKMMVKMAPDLVDNLLSKNIPKMPSKGKWETRYDKMPSAPITGLLGQLGGTLADKQRKGAR